MVTIPEKQSILEAMEHLLARYLEILPLFLAPARPMKVEWNINPYFGVLLFVLIALKYRRNMLRPNKKNKKCVHGTQMPLLLPNLYK